jgi:hypothetical protein
VVAGQEENAVDALERVVETAGIVEVPHDGFGAVRERGVRPAHQRPDRLTRRHECRNHFRAHVSGGAGDQEHGPPQVSGRG